MRKLLKNKTAKVILTIACIVVSVYVIVYVDLILRARGAYLEGEKYWNWHFNHEIKNEMLMKEFNKEKQRLDRKLKNKRITEQDYKRQLEILEFEHRKKLEESSIKYAYIWYKTAVDLFSPPRSRWVRLSEEKLPEAKEIWKKELLDKGIKVEDYMLE